MKPYPYTKPTPILNCLKPCATLFLFAFTIFISAAAISSNGEAATENKVLYIGRFDHTTPNQTRFTWPNSAIAFRFEGTQASIVIASPNKMRFQVNVDGKINDLFVKAGEHQYTLANSLSKGEHTVTLTRLSESFTGIAAITSAPIVDGKLLAPPSPAKNKLLVIGDSITAGYGVEGESEQCGYSIETSNAQKTYAAITANNLNASLHTLAWSGIGVWRSYGEQNPVNPTITVRQQRALADDSNSKWNSALYQPNAILINIGTNDFWEFKKPNLVAEQYKKHLQKLINTLRQDYPTQPFYLIVSPMLGGEKRELQKQILASFANNNIAVLDLGKIELEDGLGCHYHPNLTTQNRLATKLTTRLKADLNW